MSTVRDLGVDSVRGLALVSMYVAHCAPVMGPGGVFSLSEYLTMPLFALLVGLGADLAERRARTTGDRRRWAMSLAVRAGALVALSPALERAGAQVVIVLAHLGVLTLVAAMLARLPSVALGTLVAVTLVAAPIARNALVDDALARADLLERVLWFTLAGEPYRLSSMVAYAAAGVLLARWALRADPPRGRLRFAGLAALTGVVVLAGADATGALTLTPYSGTFIETLFDLLLVVAVFLLGTDLARALPDAVVAPLAWAGAMTLTLYALQIVYLAQYVALPGRARDDTWVNVATLTAGSLLVAAGWRSLARREPWRRGPIEGALGAVPLLGTPEGRRTGAG